MANTPTTDLDDAGHETFLDWGTGTWTELANYSSGAAPGENLESFIQGSSCASQQISANKTGLAKQAFPVKNQLRHPLLACYKYSSCSNT